MAYEHVLVVYDGTANGGAAVSSAADLARRDQARLTVAAVVELETARRGCAMSGSAWNDVLLDEARKDLLKAGRLIDMFADYRVLAGKPGRALVDGARELGCDVIVLPAPSRRRLVRMLSRNPAPALRERAHCPVLQPA